MPPPAVRTLGAVVALTAVIVFAASHSVFFWFVVSRETERAVLRKTGLLTLLRRSLVAGGRTPDALALDAFVARCGDHADRSVAPGAADDREAHNLGRFGRWIGPLLAVLTVALVGAIVYNVRTGQRLTYAHWTGLLLALFGYVPELVVYWIGTNRYSVLRDDEAAAIALGVVAADG